MKAIRNSLIAHAVTQASGACGAMFLASACTGQLPGSFRLAQQEQTFSSQLQVNTKIDLLFVVDNSSSMDVSQEKLRKGFTGFAEKYMQPTWDIRVAVITTDTYLANSAFTTYLNSKVPYTTAWTSPYISSRLGTFKNPSSNSTLVNLTTGAFDAGVKYMEMIPVWGRSFARLLPGYHDGPTTALCFEGLPYFLLGVTQCQIRDQLASTAGTEGCLRPNASLGESGLTQCVNTVENDSVHSGHAIISTLPPVGTLVPEGTVTRQAWTNQLIDHFMINATTGSVGHGSERGLGSTLQLLEDNETTETAFFRPNSLRGIIYISDEDDQTMELPSNPDSAFSPWSNYRCDQAGLEAANGSGGSVSGNNGLCCSDASKNCRFGSNGTSCPAKTVDGFTYTLSICAQTNALIPVSTVKDKIDTFFKNLDASSDTPNYFVASIVALTGDAIQQLQTSRNHDDTLVGTLKTVAVDRADRYISLGELVANGSMAMNIADDDYSPILDAIGKTIIEKKSVFTLSRVPTQIDDMIVTVVHADGTSTKLPNDKLAISGKSLIITDQNFVLGLASTDKISINYQPKTVF